MSMPVAVSYDAEGGKTGEEIKERVLGQIKTLQTCKACLKWSPSSELTVDLKEGVCGQQKGNGVDLEHAKRQYH